MRGPGFRTVVGGGGGGGGGAGAGGGGAGEEELARMLGGVEVSKEARAAARKLLQA